MKHLITFLMATLHGLSAITVKKLDLKKAPMDVAADLNRQNTASNLLLPDMPNEDTVVHGQATQIIKVYNNFKAKPPTATKQELDKEISKGATMYNTNVGYIEPRARQVAQDSGFIEDGIQLVNNSGYYLKSPRSSTESGFDGECEGAGSIKITTKAVAPRAIYVRQYGLATEEGVVPVKTEELLIGSETTIYVEGLLKLKVYAFREAYILPITRKAEDGSPDTKLEKKATKKIITSAHRRVFDITKPTLYKWGPWIWVTTY
jgi:hypothetical protein